jgi:lysophospholipase L1-like esterase
MQKKVEHKIVILEDSHTRSLAGRLRDNLSDKFEIIGYTKPNSNIAALVSNTNQDMVNLTNKDVLIFMDGTNDIITNNSKNGLRYISQYVNNNTQTYIVMLTVPHHYDLSYSSDVNNEVKKFNRKLRKYIKLNTHVTITDVNQNREYFMTHGLHFNGLGKVVICKQIANVIDDLFQTEEILPICMNWEID